MPLEVGHVLNPARPVQYEAVALRSHRIPNPAYVAGGHILAISEKLGLQVNGVGQNSPHIIGYGEPADEKHLFNG